MDGCDQIGEVFYAPSARGIHQRDKLLGTLRANGEVAIKPDGGVD
jgi:hypothetical protein